VNLTCNVGSTGSDTISNGLPSRSRPFRLRRHSAVSARIDRQADRIRRSRQSAHIPANRQISHDGHRRRHLLHRGNDGVEKAGFAGGPTAENAGFIRRNDPMYDSGSPAACDSNPFLPIGGR